MGRLLAFKELYDVLRVTASFSGARRKVVLLTEAANAVRKVQVIGVGHQTLGVDFGTATALDEPLCWHRLSLWRETVQIGLTILLSGGSRLAHEIPIGGTLAREVFEGATLSGEISLREHLVFRLDFRKRAF